MSKNPSGEKWFVPISSGIQSPNRQVPPSHSTGASDLKYVPVGLFLLGKIVKRYAYFGTISG